MNTTNFCGNAFREIFQIIQSTVALGEEEGAEFAECLFDPGLKSSGVGVG